MPLSAQARPTTYTKPKGTRLRDTRNHIDFVRDEHVTLTIVAYPCV
uniref:Uncharacterized protein n=1 Tax=Arundo donax TaxID=35708 RepID=A0A0A9B378_ARUDO